MLGINFGLKSSNGHYDLGWETLEKPSQLMFKMTPNGKQCLVYREESFIKTSDGGLQNFIKERKVVWVYCNENVNGALH